MNVGSFLVAIVTGVPLVMPSERPMPPAVVAGHAEHVGRFAMSRMLTEVKPTVVVTPLRPSQVLVSVRLQVVNPSADWLQRVRVDVEAVDKAAIGIPLSSSFLFKYLGPGERATLESDRMYLRVPTAAMARLQYEAKAKVVGGERVVLKR